MTFGNLRFSSDNDFLRFEPNLEQVWPRTDEEGNPRNNWDVQHQLAMREIQRVLDAARSVSERMELGRIGLRDQERLRDPAACFGLHFVFVAADTQGDADGWYARKAAHYWARATQMIQDIALTIDYDFDNSGTIDDNEKNQPMPERFLRG